jgi:[amino group carrier protein]-lysine/ornithine hydrolase
MTASDREAVRLLTGALKIYSPSKEESKLASFLADRMDRLGYSKVRIDRAGNVVGTVGKGGTSLLLCGHMDTIPGKLPVRENEGAIYGRGAADAKSPLCALLLAGAESADSGVRITFAGVTEEEGDGKGIEHLIRTGTKFDYAVFGEPSGADRIAVGYRGRMSLQLSVKTTGGHAGSPWANLSAFDEFLTILGRLKRYEASKEVPGDHFRSVTISPTLVRAGSYQNVVPSSCDATLDLRLPPSLTSAAAVADISSIVAEKREGVETELVAGPPTEAYEADPGSRLVRAFQRGIIIRLKAKPTLVRKTGTGDMNTFARATKAQCLTYGPGPSRASHTGGEFVEVKDYLNSIGVLKEAMVQLAALGQGAP